MKNRILAAAILLLPVGLLLFFWWHPEVVKTAPDATNSPASQTVVTKALAGQNSNTVAIIQSNFARVQPLSPAPGPVGAASQIRPAGQPAPLEFTNFAPATVLQNVSRAVRQFGAIFGGNPVGTNPEITQQLAGQNPKHLDFLSPEAGLRVNGNGELVDPWGTPLFFHQISGREMEIHSAGPDKVMWTADDLVTR
jgi:hypothetical protein